MLKANFFLKNREKFTNSLLNNSITIIIENEPYSKRDSEFFNVYDMNIFYLTGIEQEETKILFFKDSKGKVEEILFIRENTPSLEMWEGRKLSIKEANKLSKIKNIQSTKNFEIILDKYAKESKNLHLIVDEKNLRKNFNLVKLSNSIKRKYKLNFENKFDEIAKLRNIKVKDEIEIMKKSSAITNIAFRSILKNLKKVRNESEVEALLSFEYTKNLCNHSYHPIVASGINACTMHYISNNQKITRKDLILIDSGAEYDNYKSDVTRTYPLSGKFSKRQKEVYEAVLEIQKYALRELKVGITQKEWETKIAIKTLEKINGLKLVKNLKIDLKNKDSIIILKKFYPHSTGHFLGLDTHDYGDYTNPFKEGQVMTVEPALYIKEEKIGIRIEDNVVLKKKGNIVLTKNIPKEIDEIESLLNASIK